VINDSQPQDELGGRGGPTPMGLHEERGGDLQREKKGVPRRGRENGGIRGSRKKRNSGGETFFTGEGSSEPLYSKKKSKEKVRLSPTSYRKQAQTGTNTQKKRETFKIAGKARALRKKTRAQESVGKFGGEKKKRPRGGEGFPGNRPKRPTATPKKERATP